MELNNIKIQYFIDYWRDLTHPSNSIEEQIIHVILYNPKEFFKEFADEIRRKKLSNSDNKKFFFDKINQFAALDLKAIDFLRPTIQLIQKQQTIKQDDFGYLLHLINMAILKLSDFYIGREAVVELAEILTDTSSINKTKIKHLINLIIFELVHKKNSSETIAKIIDNIFSNCKEIHTSFPHNVQCENYVVSSDEFETYKSELENYMDCLTIKKRILALTNYFDLEAENLTYIFQIKGLTGDDIDLKIGKVQIYNPKSVRLIKTPSEHFNESFNSKENIFYCNGAVSLKVFDTEYAKLEAIKMLDSALDVVSSAFTNYKIPIKINESEYIIIDQEGNNRGGGTTSTWEYLTYQNSIEIMNKDYEKISIFYASKLFESNLLPIDQKIIESIHWKRKAIESVEYNENILWQWVALENLVGSPKKIFDVVSKVLATNQLYNFAWKHFNKLSDITDITAPYKHYKQQINLSDTLKNELGLNHIGVIHLKSFTDNINKFKTELDADSLFRGQIEYLEKVFTNPKECISLLDSFEKITFEKLVYVYRIRNKIVHNANNENYPLIKFYVEFMMRVTSIFINEFVYIRDTLDLQSNEEILHHFIYRYDNFKIRLKEEGTKILLENQ